MQLKDVYGDSADKIIQGNVSNIIFLKSTDNTLLETLEGMSGKTHKAYRNSKTVTTDVADLLLPTESKVSYTISTQEVPVVSYNDLAFLSERNSIVFRAGDSPIWNRNETILPMSWRLFEDTIVQPGYDYTFQTLPTLSTAKDFDVRKNQPDFDQMLGKRMAQALEADEAIKFYNDDLLGGDTYKVQQMDPDIYAEAVMEIINFRVDMNSESIEDRRQQFQNESVVNEEQIVETQKASREYKRFSVKKFADKTISPEDLYTNGQAIRGLEQAILKAYQEVRNYFYQDHEHFSSDNKGGLLGANGQVYIYKLDTDRDRDLYREAAQDPDSQVYSEDESPGNDLQAYLVTDDFFKFLSQCDRWDFAKGRFEKEMAQQMRV